MLDLVYRLYGRRVALEWRAAVLGAFVAVTVAVLGRLAGLIDFRWLVGVGGAVIVLAALGLLALAVLRPVELPAIPSEFTEREVGAAQRLVLRGETVNPPALRAAAVGQARQSLRLAHMQLAWLPIVGCIWSLGLGEGGFFEVVMYVGIVVVLLGVAGLARSGAVQRRLDRLEEADERASSSRPSPEGRP